MDGLGETGMRSSEAQVDLRVLNTRGRGVGQGDAGPTSGRWW
jgi:hypothetical protein